METEDRNNLKDYLPSDISNTSYEAKITNVSNEIVTEAQKTDASYSYNVSKMEILVIRQRLNLRSTAIIMKILHLKFI